MASPKDRTTKIDRRIRHGGGDLYLTLNQLSSEKSDPGRRGDDRILSGDAGDGAVD
jgi:hypothetical protein